MKVKVFKKYISKNMPAPGTEIECFDIQKAFGETYYLCLWHGIFLSIKEKDAREIQNIDIVEGTKGQLTFNF